MSKLKAEDFPLGSKYIKNLINSFLDEKKDDVLGLSEQVSRDKISKILFSFFAKISKVGDLYTYKDSSNNHEYQELQQELQKKDCPEKIIDVSILVMGFKDFINGIIEEKGKTGVFVSSKEKKSIDLLRSQESAAKKKASSEKCTKSQMIVEFMGCVFEFIPNSYELRSSVANLQKEFDEVAKYQKNEYMFESRSVISNLINSTKKEESAEFLAYFLSEKYELKDEKAENLVKDALTSKSKIDFSKIDIKPVIEQAKKVILEFRGFLIEKVKSNPESSITSCLKNCDKKRKNQVPSFNIAAEFSEALDEFRKKISSRDGSA